MDKTKESVFVTGSTGLLGHYLLREILETTKHNIVILVRGVGDICPAERIRFLLKDLSLQKHSSRILPLDGDLSEKIHEKLGKNVLRSVTQIFHSAAVTGFGLPLDDARRINLDGTKNILKLAESCPNLKKFNYISTAFVAGDWSCSFSENDFDLHQKFNNNYEKSKFEAELFIRRKKYKNFEILIFRPSIILGDYTRGRTTNFKMFYEPLRIFSKEILKVAPADVGCLHNIIPVDLAARAICVLGNNARGGTYHIVNPCDTKAGYFVDLAAKFFNYKNPEFIPLKQFNFQDLTPVQHSLIKVFIPYFNYKAKFLSDRTQAMLRRYHFCYPEISTDYFERIFQFCLTSGFIKRKS